MKPARLCAALLLGMLPITASADFLSISAGGGMWNAAPEGKLKRHTDAAYIDAETDLFLDTENQVYLFATFEHFVPLVPNVRVMYTKLDYDGSGTSTGFVFDGKNFTGNVTSNLSVEETDLTAYYEILDNIVSVDLGLTVRTMDIDYNIKDNGGTTTKDTFSKTIPMLYGLVGASPWPDLILSAEGSFFSLDGNTVTDVIAKVAYTTNFFLGFEAGYRMQQIKLNDIHNTDSDLKFNGAFAGAYLKF